MPDVTWACNKDARVAYNGSNLGAGTSDFNPVGTYSGYEYMTLLGFAYSFAGMVSITKAVLHLRVSNQYYVGFGSDPDMYVAPQSSAWSEGSSSSMSTSNAVHFGNKPGLLANSFTGPFDISTTENAWVALDITHSIQTAFATGSFHGLQLYPASSASSDVTEFYSREQGSSDPYIVVTYTNNVKPNTPVISAPSGVVSDLTPNIVFTASDPDVGDTLDVYSLQVATDSGFVNKVWDLANQTSGISGWGVTRTYAGPALTPGTTYYVRVNVRDASLYSDWSTAKSFSVNRAPTVVFSQPSAADALVELTKTAGSGIDPRIAIRWTFSDVDAGDSQAYYQVVIVTDAGAAFWDSTKTAGAAAAVYCPVYPTRGAFYKVTVTVWDETGATGTTGQRRFKVNWGIAEYKVDLLAVPTNWAASPATAVGTNQAAAVEYASSASGGAIAAGSWESSLAGAALNRWFHWRVWLFAWSGAASPSATKMSLTYTTDVGVPADGWTVPAQGSLDKSTRVYGTQSQKIACDGTNIYVRQLVSVEPNTDYILSARIKSTGNSGSRVRLSATTTGGSVQNAAGEYITSPTVVATQDFTALRTPVWNSGSNTSIWVQFLATGAVGTAAWCDAIKLEASTVVTPWTPGFVGSALTIDVGGIQVDAKAGAVLRLMGSVGAARDTVELGAHGLLFGSDMELYSENPGWLRVKTDAPANMAVIFESADSTRTGLLYFKRGGDASYRMQVGEGGLYFGDGAVTPDVRLYRSAADTLRTPDALTVDGVLTSTGLFRQGGNAFPAGPVADDVFFRNDRNMWFLYDGTRWVCACVHIASFGPTTAFLAATTLQVQRQQMPYSPWGGQVYFDQFEFSAFLNTGGTALSASHKWQALLRRETAAQSPSTMATAEIATGAVSNWLRSAVAANFASASTYGTLAIDYVRTGTPGNIVGMAQATYRFVG